MRLLRRCRSFITIVFAALLALTLLGGATPGSDRPVLAQDGLATDAFPAIFTADSDGILRGSNVVGTVRDAETFDNIFGADPSVLEAIAVDYVTQSGGTDVFGASVIAADADTGLLYVSAGVVIDSSAIGFVADIGFGANDRILIANVSRDNDDFRGPQFPERVLDEILVVRDGSGLIDVYQYDDSVSGNPIVQIDTFDLGFSSAENVVAGDIATVNGPADRVDNFLRFGQDGLAEIVVVDPATRGTEVFDHTGSPVITTGFNLTVEPGQRLATGDVDGAGGEEILVIDPATGTVEIFDASINPDGDLILGVPETISADVGPDDQVDLVDIYGNGIDEILVADADSGDVSVFRYDLVAQDFFTEPSLPVDYAAGDLFTVVPIRYPDVDGDGLFDHWETNGVDVDGDGTIEIDLPALGADPMHKDLFVEYDYVKGQEPSSFAIDLVLEAFENAPLTAGGIRNPDFEPGINLRIDTGGLTELGQPVGEDLGGGEAIDPAAVPADGICGLGQDFQEIKEKFFEPVRTHVFRYALSIEQPDGCEPSGEGEIGGNDFVEHADVSQPDVSVNDEAALFMHELGHTLSLLHGGFESHNCKPNYLSIMNYAHGGGIPRVDNSGVTTIDYAPARIADGRAGAPLPVLVESSLDEEQRLDPTDQRHRLVFSSPTGVTLRRAVSEMTDWNQENGIESEPVDADIDNIATFSNCRDNNEGIEDDPFVGHDDWSGIALSVRNSGNSAAGVVEAPPIEEPSIEELIELQEDLHTSDLSLTVTGDPDPVAAGGELDYEITVENLGPNPAEVPTVELTLPEGLTFQDSDIGCATDPGEVTCALDEIAVGGSTSVTITVLVGADLVFEAGGPTTVTTSASVANTVDVANDPETGNNEATVETEVVAEADLEIASFEATDAPVEILFGETGDLTLEKVVTNNGPSGPIDAEGTVTAALISGADDGVSVEADPENPQTLDALDVDEERTLTELFTLTCIAPGSYDVTFTNTVSPLNPADSDPDTANNEAQVTVPVECIVPVQINIKPGETPNVVDAEQPGFPVPLAALTTEAGEYGLPFAFDAATIDDQSVLFGARDGLLDVATPSGASEIHGQGHVEDSFELDETTQDGDLDMVLHFQVDNSGLDEFDLEACLRGEAAHPELGNVTFFGCDSIIPPPDVCADVYSGHLRQVRGLECGPGERGIIFHLEAPVHLCASFYTGEIVASATADCPTGSQLIVMPDDGPVTTCASLYTGELRYPRTGTCEPTETVYVLE